MKILWYKNSITVYLVGLSELWSSSLPDYVKVYFNDNYGRVDLGKSEYVWRIL